MITHNQYVPLLRWRMGEYQALLRLEASKKLSVLPMIEVLEPDFDFEKWIPKKTIDEQLSTFASQLNKKWGERPALLDARQLPPTTRMADGRHPMTYLFDETRALGGELTPVTALDYDASYQAAVRGIHALDGRGAVLRCTLEEALDPDFDVNVAALLAALGLSLSELDLVLDLRAPAYEPLQGLVGVVQAALGGSSTMANARSLVVMAASFPDSLAHLKTSLELLPRNDWLFYRSLIAALPKGVRRPAFGDYAVAAVAFPKGDMRFMRGAPNIRYATTGGWLVARRKRLKGETNQAYPGLCTLITGASAYHGATYSAGSGYISDCEHGRVKRGNPTTWKWVATNHHITVVLDDLARLPAP
ncbi:MAG: beta family protein [Brevundimonas sp.]|uniref:beta family protein n=1 Tax=Brevundimonas sp. TaxID=1871086 RepID=UPI0039188BBE